MKKIRNIVAAISASFIVATGMFYFAIVRPALAGVTCSLPFTLTNGTVADATQVMANYNALVTCLTNAAAAGANNDITSLSALTTPITPNEGGSNVYIGTPTVSGNILIIGSATVPTGWANVTGQSVVFVAPVANTTAEQLVVNNQATKNVYKLSSAGPIPLTGGEIVTSQVYQAIYDGTQFEINPFPNVTAGWGISVVPTAVSINTTHPPYGFGPCINMTIEATVGSNLLGLQILAADTGLAPTTSHPILCNFRDTTLANGDPVWTTIASPTYMDTNAVGATLGTDNGLPFRFWVVLFYNGGSPTLGLWQSTSFTPLASAQSDVVLNTLDESDLQSPTAISNAATSAGTFYSPNGTSISNSSFRILGYMDWSSGLTTAGTYASGPTKIQLFGPGIKKPGDRINVYHQTTGATITSSNFWTPSATPPVPTNGTTVVSQTVTPSAPMDIWRVSGFTSLANNNTTENAAFIWNGSHAVAVGFGISSGTLGVNGIPGTIATYFSTIITASSMTFMLYGACGNSTCAINASPNGNLMGGSNSSLSIEEVQP